jgi:hypothetical protein
MYISYILRKLRKLEANTVYSTPTFVEIGEITYQLINAQAVGVEEIDFVFSLKKPVDKLLKRLVFKNDEQFTSGGYGSYYYTTNAIADIFLKENSTINHISDAGIHQPEKQADNITVSVILSSGNLQDWTSGKVKVFAELVNYPNV